MRGKGVGMVAIGWSLACAGLEIPGVEPALPPDPAVVELLEAEAGDEAALEGDALTARTLALTAFLSATTDFADWKAATLDCLAADCAPTTEAAYAKARVDYAPKPPLVATETGDPWRVFVIVDHLYAGSEDWLSFADELEDALPAEQVATVRAGLGEYGVSVTAAGAEIAAIDLKKFVTDHEPRVGYVVAKEGSEPLWIDHSMPPDVTSAACAYLQIECAATGEEGDEPADPDAPVRVRPPGARAKAKAKAKAKAGL